MLQRANLARPGSPLRLAHSPSLPTLSQSVALESLPFPSPEAPILLPLQPTDHLLPTPTPTTYYLLLVLYYRAYETTTTTVAAATTVRYFYYRLHPPSPPATIEAAPNIRQRGGRGGGDLSVAAFNGSVTITTLNFASSSHTGGPEGRKNGNAFRSASPLRRRRHLLPHYRRCSVYGPTMNDARGFFSPSPDSPRDE